MKVLVIGGGGREHAIVRALKDSPEIDRLYCAPGNGGIGCDAQNLPIGAMDKEKMVAFAVENGIGFAVVAPDDPLAAGMVDALEAAGIPCFGPDAKAALIEASKVFSKELMKKYNIPTGGYEVFTNAAAAIDYVRRQDTYPAVIKADGLALGKGVILAQNFEEAKAAITDMIIGGKFGKSGARVVVEEFLTGPEVSVLCFTDGKTIKPMVSSMDHKRALDGDQGLNTGGMGTVAPNPCYTPAIAQICMDTIFRPTVDAMVQEGRPFKGCLYFGLMLTPDGPKVIEYNCRFGDPETQVVLPLLKSDLFTIMRAVHDGTLADVDVEFSAGCAACVVLASGGYPQAYKKGIPMYGMDQGGQIDGATVYHAGTVLEDGVFKTNGGRVLGVTATGDTLQQALDKAYAAAKQITFDGVHYRRDIGQRALAILHQN